jgi:hypothetical protein
MRWFCRFLVLASLLAAVIPAVPVRAEDGVDDVVPEGEVQVLPHWVISGDPISLTTVFLAAPAMAEAVAGEPIEPVEAELPDTVAAPTEAEEAEVEEKEGDIVRMGEPVVVLEHQVVSGDIVVIGGQADILGKVNGDVVAIGGAIVLGPKAEIMGDAVSIGGGIDKAVGAKVYGQEVSMAGIPIPFLGLGLKAMESPLLANALGLLWTSARILAVVLFCILVAFVIPRPLQVISTALRDDVVKAGLIGLLIEFLSLPGIVALVISIVGIFAVPAVVLLLLVAGLVGLTASSLLVGRRLLRGRSAAALVAPVAAGAAIIQAPSFVARLLGFSGVLLPVKLVFAVLGGVTLYLGITVGLGAVWLTRFGRRAPGVAGKPAAPAAAPSRPMIPPAPPEPPAPPTSTVQEGPPTEG